MTEAEKMNVEQIKAVIPKLTDDEFHELSKAFAKDAGRRIRNEKPRD